MALELNKGLASKKETIMVVKNLTNLLSIPLSNLNQSQNNLDSPGALKSLLKM
jgi:hypothetical protein